VGAIGRTDQANHQYDLVDFWAAVDAGNMPAVSFVKAPAYQDGHAGYSDPLDEQATAMVGGGCSSIQRPGCAPTAEEGDSSPGNRGLRGPVLGRAP